MASSSPDERLSLVFKALADPTRRQMLSALKEGDLTLSELARPHAMTLPAVMKHLKVLAEAGLIEQKKAGRVRHCRLDEGPLVEATVWMSRHCKYWQNQFEVLATLLTTPDKGEQQ
jgi:DNA-binding transcriptional ArsR family regulator